MNVNELEQLHNQMHCQCGAELSHSPECYHGTLAASKKLRELMMQQAPAIITALRQYEKFLPVIEYIRRWARSDPDTGRIYLNGPVMSAEESTAMHTFLEEEFE